MQLADPEAALGKLREFRARLRTGDTKGIYDLQPLIEDIASESTPTMSRA